MSEASGNPVWLFDGVCVLCSRGVQYTLKHERQPLIRFVAIQSDEGRKLAVQHNIDPDTPDTFLFIEGGSALQKSDGVVALAAYLRGPAMIFRIGRFLPRNMRDAIYDWVAQNRYRLFGKTDVCIIPTPQTRHRFVLPEVGA